MDFNLHLISLVILLMMEWLPVDNARSLHPHGKAKNRTKSGCVGGKWVQVGIFRFWQRKSCGNRRQARPMEPQPGKPKIDLEDLPSIEGGPERGMSYDPTYGYEPYWEDGDWVFDPRPSNKSDANFMCGTRCSKVYTEYGELCGRNKFYEYKTFANFCQLKSQDCSGIQRWMILYRGKCYREIIEFERHDLNTRARNFIKAFMSTHTEYPKFVGFCSEKSSIGPYNKK